MTYDNLSKKNNNTEIHYKPLSVREVLKDMKNASELAVHLGYLSILLNDKQLSEGLNSLEERIDSLAYQLWMSAALSARDAEDAEKIVGLIKLGSVICEISNAAADLGKLVIEGLSDHPSLQRIFQRIERRFARIKVSKYSVLHNRSIENLRLDTTIGIDIIAIKRMNQWITDPNDDEVIKKQDVLLARGALSGLLQLSDMAGAQPPPSLPSSSGLPILDKIEDLLVELIDTTDMMLNLAYTALIYNNLDIAQEVLALEEAVDTWHLELELEALQLCSSLNDRKKILGLIRLGLICEILSDAAASIANITIRGGESHEILQAAIEEAEDTVTVIPISERGRLAMKTIYESKLIERLGLDILAIRKKGVWLYAPGEDVKMNVGDEIIACGTKDSIYILESMAGKLDNSNVQV